MEKTKGMIRDEILNNLAGNIGINTREEGSIAVAIVDSVIDEIWHLHQELDFMRDQAYLSTSIGQYTDLIGELVGVERDDFESDDDMKIKAATSVQRHAKGNRLAIEEAARAVSGVASIDYRPYGAGVGSFVMYVYPEVNGNQHRLLERVEAALVDVVADGVYYEVKEPNQTAIDIDAVIQFDHRVSNLEKQALKRQIQGAVRSHINQLRREQVLVINTLIQQMLNVSEHIIDVSIVNLVAGGVRRTVTNLFPASDERIVAGDITII